MVKRLAVRLEDVADRDNLVLATWKAAQGKHDRPAVARFLSHLDDRLADLSARIHAGIAPLGRQRAFTIHDPKRRVIHAACFADRVLHHAILNLTEPAFERALVDTSFACRPGKGVHAAVTRVQRELRRWPWLVQVDVAHYFPNIDHARLHAMLAQRFKGAGFLALLGRIVEAGATDTPGRGLPIGALTSQHFANAYLDRADRWLLETRREDVRAVVRYMDDIVWWCDSQEAARDTLAGLRGFMSETLGLTLKPGVRLQRSEAGLTYCGHRITPGLVRPSPRKLVRYRRAAARLVVAECCLSRGLAPPGVDESALQRAHDVALATLAHTQSLHFRRRVWQSAPIGCDDPAAGDASS